MNEGNFREAMDRPIMRALMWDNRIPTNLPGVQVTLEGRNLWKNFHEVTTEMIITKSGRNMFPVLSVRISGLEPNASYFIAMEVRLASENRYKYVGDSWKSSGRAEQQQPPSRRIYVHPDSPGSGEHWMRQPIQMKTAKITNNTDDKCRQIILTSMHRYIPYIHVIKTLEHMDIPRSPTATFSFPETEFIAVTAYQNDRVTKLKINNNPFAKGFRENGLSSKNRKANGCGKRKRVCLDRSSCSPVDSVKSSSTAAEDCDCAERNGNCKKHCEHSENSLVPVTGSHCEELTAITNISINANTIQYPYNRLYPPLYPPLYHENSQYWRLPLLLPPQHPVPGLINCLMPIPYNSPPFFFPPPIPHFPHSSLLNYGQQPCDYSMRDRST